MLFETWMFCLEQQRWESESDKEDFSERNESCGSFDDSENNDQVNETASTKELEEKGPNILETLTKQRDGRREECQSQKDNLLPCQSGCSTKPPARYTMEAFSKILFPITKSDESLVQEAMNLTKDKARVWRKAIEKELYTLEEKKA